MVYPGHPSKGCIRCKERRVKCDATRPVCLRCTKYGIVCPGYAQKAFKFHDVTDRTRNKAAKSYVKRGSRARDDQETPDRLEGSRALILLPSGEQIAYSADLARPAMLKAAIGAFWYRCDESSRGMFSVASTLYKGCISNQPLTAAFEAFALMSLALQPSAQRYDVKRTAIKQYSNSLASIGRALGDPALGLSDATIMAIFLVSMLEIHVSHSPTGTYVEPNNGNRAAHLHRGQQSLTHFLGILNIIKLKGTRQFATLAGRQLFLNAASIWHAMVLPLPIPVSFPIGDELCHQLTTFADDENSAAYQLVPLFNRNITLRRDAMLLLGIPRLHGPEEWAIRSILDRVEALEKSFVDWRQSHSFGVDKVLSMNTLRVCQIFAEDLRVRCFRFLNLTMGEDHTTEVSESGAKAKQAVDEICATMPYDFSPDDPRARAPHVVPPAAPELGVDILYHLPFSFPLLITAMTDAGISDEQKQGIRSARRACSAGMGTPDPVRDFPRLLVEMGAQQRRTLCCPRCGSDYHYDGQTCEASIASEEDRKLLMQNKAAIERLREPDTSN